jgi:hypothetical protein
MQVTLHEGKPPLHKRLHAASSVLIQTKNGGWYVLYWTDTSRWYYFDDHDSDIPDTEGMWYDHAYGVTGKDAVRWAWLNKKYRD